jgi:NAD(P)-dependent dehydrogenase (short-subunit alcohol dehydrogenase family)
MNNEQEKRPAAKEMPEFAEKLPYPAKQSEMKLQPDSDLSNYRAADKLRGHVAIITGGDSGIGRAVAIAFCKEGANVSIVYNENDEDAQKTRELCEQNGGKCLVIKADVRSRQACFEAVEKTVDEFGELNILVNNAAYQKTQEKIEDISEEQLRRTFETNIFAYFFMVQAALPHLKAGDSIVNTGSIVGLTGHPILIDYTATKGAIHAFTKSLAFNLGSKGIRVNSVVPGPVWTPNIPGTMPLEEIEKFGHEVALERPGQPEEIAPAFVLLASSDGSFMTGSLVHVTGGKMSSD